MYRIDVTKRMRIKFILYAITLGFAFTGRAQTPDTLATTFEHSFDFTLDKQESQVIADFNKGWQLTPYFYIKTRKSGLEIELKGYYKIVRNGKSVFEYDLGKSHGLISDTIQLSYLSPKVAILPKDSVVLNYTYRLYDPYLLQWSPAYSIQKSYYIKAVNGNTKPLPRLNITGYTNEKPTKKGKVQLTVYHEGIATEYEFKPGEDNIENLGDSVYFELLGNKELGPLSGKLRMPYNEELKYNIYNTIEVTYGYIEPGSKAYELTMAFAAERRSDLYAEYPYQIVGKDLSPQEKVYYIIISTSDIKGNYSIRSLVHKVPYQ